MRYYLSDVAADHRPAPYVVPFALASLAASAHNQALKRTRQGRHAYRGVTFGLLLRQTRQAVQKSSRVTPSVSADRKLPSS